MHLWQPEEHLAFTCSNVIPCISFDHDTETYWDFSSNSGRKDSPCPSQHLTFPCVFINNNSYNIHSFQVINLILYLDSTKNLSLLVCQEKNWMRSFLPLYLLYYTYQSRHLRHTHHLLPWVFRNTLVLLLQDHLTSTCFIICSEMGQVPSLASSFDQCRKWS